MIYENQGNENVEVKINWTPSALAPDGITLYFFPHGGAKPYVFMSNNVNILRVRLPDGKYDMLAINDTESEYSYLSFQNMDNFAEAIASVKRITVPEYQTGEGESLIANPDMLAVDTLQNIQVSASGYSCGCSGEKAQVTALYIEPRRLVYTLQLRVYINGINNLRSAAAAIKGMASRIKLTTQQSTTNTGTQIFNFNSIHYLNETKTSGYLEAVVPTFGLPYTPDNTTGNETLKLRLTLTDNSIHEFEIPVGNRFIIDDDNNLHILMLIGAGTMPDDLPISLPDVTPVGGVGFDPDIKDWGDPIIVGVDI